METSAKNMLGSLYQEEDDLFEIPSRPDSRFFLNHQTNKSSVLCPESQNITCQYLALQQLDAHHRMIARAKGTVDNTAPKSMRSYKSIADRKKKSFWQQQQSNSRPSAEMKQSSDLESRKAKMHADDQFEDDESLNCSSVNKGVQTSVPFCAFNSKTADKISWYLEAIHQGELQSHFFMCSSPQSTSVHSANHISSTGNSMKKRIIRGDIMEWHKDQFSKSSKSFSPKILANNNAKSKVKGMRCYNPPYRKKKTGSVNSSDTFESYEDEEEYNEDDFEEEESDVEEIREEAPSEASQVRINSNKERPSFSSAKIAAVQKLNSTSSSNPLFDLNRNKEDKYLNFLGKVTEDILRSGVYTDRAIQRAFEFHMQFHQNDEDRSKLQMLLEQVLEGLQISSEETDEIMTRRGHFSNQETMSISRPATPPEKENPDVFSGLSNLLRTKNLSLESSNDEETVTSHPDIDTITTEISKQVHQLSVDNS